MNSILSNLVFQKVFLFIFFLFFAYFPLKPEELKLSLEDAVRNVLENNLTVKNAKMEIAKSDSNTIKNSSKYVWKIIGDVSVFKNVQPLNNTTIISGNKFLVPSFFIHYSIISIKL